MNAYLSTVIVTVTVCQIAQMITQNTEAYRRIVHIMCAMVVLLTIVGPIRWLADNFDEASVFIRDLMDDEIVEVSEEDPLNLTAQAVMEHAAAKFALDPVGMKAVLITDDRSGELTEIQLFVIRCAYSQRADVSEKLTEMYGIPVYIYSNQGE